VSGYRVRLANAGDLPSLAEVERRACARFDAFGLSILAQVITPPEDLIAAQADARLWVAVERDEGPPIGFALACELGGGAHLDELDVLPEHGRRGVGAALVETVCAWARARRLPSLTLSTMRDIPWNAPFYRALGFRALDGAALPPALRGLRDHEAARGLPMDGRVYMLREINIA